MKVEGYRAFVFTNFCNQNLEYGIHFLRNDVKLR
jgi:hypothetical protein